MSDHTSALPEPIREALAHHQEAKASYQTLRERLASLGQRLEKHRKTQAAATVQSDLAGTTWRAKFHAADGELNREIRDLKREELDARELAEEYGRLVEALEPEFGLLQLDTAEAFLDAEQRREDAHDLYARHCLESAATELFALPEGQALISALADYRQTLRRELAKHPAYEPDGRAQTQEQIRVALEQRQGQVLNALLQKATADPVERQDDPIWQGLEAPVPSGHELPKAQIGSHLSRMRRRQELEALSKPQKRPVSAE
ncbi:hypothetical protein [Metapseudomonas furukawaii]|uniref:Uncharacterized protein n=1 Tax=Metapseudomonas furukawaii TaxID=1149133 RepID=A0AAD1C1G9_METFU|nr:hypothetical protein [Pseudomonas furukawaii]ELS28587.1 hypothetical protein ppKF707_1673 [Pseudomonas furukawaii]BAU75173.1 hypothetical protein KF707C_34850 [Pseudomonas furukawaii]